MLTTDAAHCHHCHIHASFPVQDLKRTHPLRSGNSQGVGDTLTSSFRKNVSFLYRKFPGVSLAAPTPPPPPPPPPPTHQRSFQTSSTASLHGSHSSSLPHSLPRSSKHSSRHSSHHPSHHSSRHSSRQTSNHSTPRSSPPPLRDPRPALVLDSQPLPPLVSRKPLPPLPFEPKKQRGYAGLQAVLLVGAYALLLVLAVVVGVVLSQEAVRRPPRPILQSGGPAPVRVVRPRPRPQELDFVEIEPNPLSGPPPQAAQPRPAPPPPPPVRRPTFTNIDTDFSLTRQQQEEELRGRKEPEIKVLKSWNNVNADGTLSWGYISEDGSFKNETRGHDCVVRGVYGYVEQETGKLLSFPYVTGNPCDPNEPDYYDYYDGGVDEFAPSVDVRGRTG